MAGTPETFDPAALATPSHAELALVALATRIADLEEEHLRRPTPTTARELRLCKAARRAVEGRLGELNREERRRRHLRHASERRPPQDRRLATFAAVCRDRLDPATLAALWEEVERRLATA